MINSKITELEGKFPVFVIDRVNHGQVASGELPDVVIERDVDAEVDGDEAYKRYVIALVLNVIGIKITCTIIV